MPSDWGNYYSNCGICGTRSHESEGGCPCTDDRDLCVGRNCGHELNLDHYHPETTEVEGKHYCEDCLRCECCDSLTDITYNEDLSLLLCPVCVPDEHECRI